VYIDSVTAQLKRWIDRSANAMHCMMLLGKYGCAVSTTGGFKEQEVVDYLNHVITDLGIVSVGGVGIAMAKGPEAFSDAMRRAHDLGRDLVLAIKKEKKFPDGETKVQERKEFFKKLVVATRIHGSSSMSTG
jgi:multimeric flavodoxin WrbA